MDAAIITVGDEILAGDITNTNAAWLASELTSRGVSVREITTVPDDAGMIAAHTRRCSGTFDAVIVTGGIGGTPDDVTMDGVARAFEVALEENATARADVEETLVGIHERRPDLDLDVATEASLPTGSRPLLNPEGISPGCVHGNVYVLPGIPREMKAMFGVVEAEFAGDLHSRTTYTSEPESNIAGLLAEVRDAHGVSVGCYPDVNRGPKRIKVIGEDAARVDLAFDELTRRLEVEHPSSEPTG